MSFVCLVTERSICLLVHMSGTWMLPGVIFSGFGYSPTLMWSVAFKAFFSGIIFLNSGAFLYFKVSSVLVNELSVLWAREHVLSRCPVRNFSCVLADSWSPPYTLLPFFSSWEKRRQRTQTYFLLRNMHHECTTGETRPSVLVGGLS